MDLGVNSGKAAAVEQWFDDLTEFDEKAEATAAGKIAVALVNIGVPGGIAFKHLAVWQRLQCLQVRIINM